MKAIVLRRPGDRDALSLETVPDPTPGPRDVVIRIEACGVCFHDIVVRNGTLKAGVQLPCIPGHEISGRVVEVGADVRTFKPGDRVATVQRDHICGCCRLCRTGLEPLCPESRLLGDWGLSGGYAEYVAVEHDNVAHVPDAVPLSAAAIVACTIGTILNAIREVGHLQPGESALVTGAGGGLGMHAIQLARLAGAHVVAVTSSPGKAAAIRAQGAHAVIAADRGSDFSAAVKAATDGQGVDVVIDNVGSPTYDAVRRSIAIGGRWLLIGQLTGQFVSLNPAQLIYRKISLLAARGTTRKQLEDCLALVARGQVKPIVDQTLPLDQAAVAHRLVETGQALGRVLLTPLQTSAC